MHATTTPSAFRRFGLPLLLFSLLSVSVLVLPPLAFPLAFVMPLIVCPAQISVGLWFALFLPLVPCAGLLWAGADVLLSLCTLPFAYLSLLASVLIRRMKPDFLQGTLFYVLAFLTSLALLCVRLGVMLGGNLFEGLAIYLTQAVADQPAANRFFFLLIQNGVLALPPQMHNSPLLLLGQNIFLIPSLRVEILNAFRFVTMEWLYESIPALLLQLSLVIGLFASLHTARESARLYPRPVILLFHGAKGEWKSQASAFPSLRTLFLPPSYQRHVLFLALAALVLLYAGDGKIPSLMSSMMLSAVTTVYALLGAATLVFVLCQKNPQRTVLAGLAAGALFVTFPTLLWILGFCDQFFHLRASALFQKEEDSSK